MTAPDTIRDLAVVYGSLQSPRVLTDAECERFAEFVASRWPDDADLTNAQWRHEFWAWSAREIAGKTPATAGPAEGHSPVNSPGAERNATDGAGGF